jgi:hypothetical protein
MIAAPGLLGLSFLAFVIRGRFRAAAPTDAEGRHETWIPSLSLSLLPLTFIGQYVISNAYFLTNETALRVFAGFSLLSLVFVVLIPRLLSSWVKVRLLVGAHCYVLVIVFSMPAAAYEFQWGQAPGIVEPLIYLLVVGGLLSLLMLQSTRIIALICTLFFVSSLGTISARHPQDFTAQAAIDQVDFGAVLKHRPDVYVMTYDSYVGSETLEAFGLDNHVHEEYLRSLGFTLYPQTYTRDIFSAESMSLVFEPGLRPSSGLEEKRKVLAGTSAVTRYFQVQGYLTETVTDPYLVHNQIPTFDFMYPNVRIVGSGILFAREILRGAFTAEFWEEMFRIAKQPDVSPFASFSAAKRERLGAEVSAPRLLVAHSPTPGHSDFVGRCDDNSIREFGMKLQKANAVMRDDLQKIFESGNQSIVVVNGDHGPAITGDCHVLRNLDRDEIARGHLQDRWGSFLAIRWPDGMKPKAQPTVLQDLFPIILATLSEDETFLELRQSPVTYDRFNIGVRVIDGKIEGGRDDGKTLFETDSETQAVEVFEQH